MHSKTDCLYLAGKKDFKCYHNFRNAFLEIVLFESLSNCKRRNKGNFTSKSNSNRIMLCGAGGQHSLILNKILTL